MDLSSRKGKRHVAHLHLHVVRQEPQSAHRELRELGSHAAPQDRADARVELAHVERLHDVVVRTGAKSAEAIHLLVARRDAYHRQAWMQFADQAKHVAAVDSGQAEIEQHEIRHDGMERFECVFTAPGGRERVRQTT